MSVSSTINKVSHFYSGATRTFPFSFRIISELDLEVTVERFGGQLFTLVLGQDYTVTGVNFSAGGTITILNSYYLEVSDVIKIKRTVYNYTQDTVFRNQGAFYAATVEDALDKLTMMAQELKTRIDIVPTFPDTDLNVDYQFPAPVAGSYIRYATRTVGGQTQYYLQASTFQSSDLPVVPISKGGTGATTSSDAWSSISASGVPTQAPSGLGAIAAAGTSSRFAREDHVHARPSLTDLNAASRGANTDISSVALTSGTISSAPSSGTSIVNKTYVDGAVPSNPVRIVSTVTLSNVGQQATSTTITGTTLSLSQITGLSVLSLGERVLVANQNDPVQNGIYSLTQNGLPWVLTRTSDWAVGSSRTPSDVVYVARNAFVFASATSWSPTANINVGTTGSSFVQVTGAPSDSTPLAATAGGTIGSNYRFAREDHTHPRSSLVDLGAAARGVNTDITSVALTSGTVTTTPSAANDLANKAYVDAQTQGINYHQAVNFGTTANLAATRSGNVLTATATNTPLVLDGSTVALNQRVLVKNQTTAQDNGIYTLTTAAATGVAWQLTRATDYDSVGTGADQITAGDFILILSGSTLANTAWVLQTSGTITLNTTALTFTQFAGAAQPYTAGTGLTLTGNQFSTNLTAAELPTVPITKGGTGATTQQAALNALAGGVTANRFLRGDGTNVVLNTIQQTDLPAFAGDVTGSIGANTVSKLGGYTLTVGTPADFSTFVYNKLTNAIELGTRMSDLLGYSASQPSVNLGVGSLIRQSTPALATTSVVLYVSSATPRHCQITFHHGLVWRANVANQVATFVGVGGTNQLMITAGIMNFADYAVVGSDIAFNYSGSAFAAKVTGVTGTFIYFDQLLPGFSSESGIIVSITSKATTKTSNNVINGFASRFVDNSQVYQPITFYPAAILDQTDPSAGSASAKSTVDYRVIQFELDSTIGTYASYVPGTLTTFAATNIAIGYNSGATVTTGNNNVLIGSNSDVSSGANAENVSIGNEAVSIGSDNVAVGANANAEAASGAPGSVAVGADSQGRTGVAIGAGANALTGTAVGTNAFARNDGVAIGAGATVQTSATQAPPIAIGKNAIARAGQTVVGAQTSTVPIDFQRSPRSSYYGTGTNGTNTITLSGSDFDGLSVDMNVAISNATAANTIITAINGAVLTLSQNLIGNVVAGTDRINVTHPFAMGCDGSATGAIVQKNVTITSGSAVISIPNGTSGLKVGAVAASNYAGFYFSATASIVSISATSVTMSSAATTNASGDFWFDTRAQLSVRTFTASPVIIISGNYASRIPVGSAISTSPFAVANNVKVLKSTYNANVVFDDIEGATYVTLSRYSPSTVTSQPAYFQRQDYRLVVPCSISASFSYYPIISHSGSTFHPSNVSTQNLVQFGDKVTIDRTRSVIALFTRNITAANTSSNQITFSSVKGLLSGMVIETIGGTTLGTFLTINTINTATKTVTVSANSPYTITSSTSAVIRGTNMFALGWSPTWENATIIGSTGSTGFAIDAPVDLALTQVDLIFTPSTGGAAIGANSYALNNELAFGSVPLRSQNSTQPTVLAGYLPITASGVEGFVALYARPTAG